MKGEQAETAAQEESRNTTPMPARSAELLKAPSTLAFKNPSSGGVQKTKDCCTGQQTEGANHPLASQNSVVGVV